MPPNVAQGMNGAPPGHQQGPPQQQVPGGAARFVPGPVDPNTGMVQQPPPNAQQPYNPMQQPPDMSGQPRPLGPPQPGMPQQQAAMMQGARPLHTPEQRQQILHQQQQRLLFLRHASKCQHVNDKCPQGYANCKGMKDLWKHIASCREQRCQYPHCVSSRYVLSHYHKCKDERCPVCGPVRHTIRNTNRPNAVVQQGQQPGAPTMAGPQAGQPGVPMAPGMVPGKLPSPVSPPSPPSSTNLTLPPRLQVLPA